MKKNLIKSILSITMFFILSIILSSNCLAATDVVLNTNTNSLINQTQQVETLKSRTTLELVDDSVCTIEIDDIAKFQKKITKFDAENKSATLTLTITNTKTVEETQKPVEIFLVIDNSSSMIENKVGDMTRKQIVIDSANKLVEKLFAANANAKVGIVSFSSLDSSKDETEGTINDAKLWLNLSDAKDNVKAAISSISSSNCGPRTNIEAGITLAADNYSSDGNTNRYIVLLTDGVPNNATDGTFATYSGTVATRTKAKLQSIEQSGIKVIGSMIGLDGEKIEVQTNKTYKALAEEVFGTIQAPTISKYYYIPDNRDEIETNIVDDIYANIVSVADNKLKNITIKDYFPQEIIDNFNFKHVASPNIGKVSTKVDTSDNSITWNIEVLNEGETATLSYMLTLKENYNKEIIDKILPTNTKVDITAENKGEKIETSSDVSPKVKVLYQEDTTVANTIIPQTGDSDTTLWFVGITTIIAIIVAIRFILLKNKENK